MDTSPCRIFMFWCQAKGRKKTTKNKLVEFGHFLQNENRQIESDETM